MLASPLKHFAVIALISVGGAAPAAGQELAKGRVAELEWPETIAVSVPAEARTRLEGLDGTYLPVLVPRTFLKYKSLKYVGEPLHYTASVQANGATLSITGTRIAIDSESEKPPVRPEELMADVGEQRVEGSIRMFGAAYLLTVECDKSGDARCTSTDYVRGLWDSAQFMGGNDGTPPAMPALPGGTEPEIIGVSGSADFAYDPPGKLAAGSGRGVSSTTIFSPGIRFPVAEKPAYLNSQVWGIGGQHGQAGSWRDRRNYAYPWRDNFCETRGYTTPLCPAGKGHQGVDIRPAGPEDRKYVAVAVEPGRISKIGTYAVTLSGDSGTLYNYLHLEKALLKVKVGDRVTGGQPIGLISNDFGGTPTPVHLHFEMKQNANGNGWRHVPPYTSLVAAYQRM